MAIVSGGGGKAFFTYYVITWSMSHVTRRTRYPQPKSNRTQQQKYMCITNWGKLVLQIGPALSYYKLGQTLLQIGTASLLQIGASVVTNWGSYYKLGQTLLQSRAAITNWRKIYYKLKQVLQIRAIITNWGIKVISYKISENLKCKISVIWFVQTVCIFLIFVIAAVQISMEYETRKSWADI